MGVDQTVFVAYGVIVDASMRVDSAAVDAAGFARSLANCYSDRSKTFIYLEENVVYLNDRTLVEEIAEPFDEEEERDNEEEEEKNERKRKPVYVGARISVPIPSKQACEALRDFVLENKLVKEKRANPIPRVFVSVC